jgi:hypothetical protein
MKKLNLCQYEIIEKSGRYGLAYVEKIVIESIYGSLELAGDDLPPPPYERLARLENDPLVNELYEWDCKVVKADGKAGIIEQNRLLSELKYDRVIKLTFMHLLCQSGAAWTMFNYHGWLHPTATITTQEDLTLDLLLRILSEEHPSVSAELSKYLFKDKERGRYVSEYRRYTGSEYVTPGFDHPFLISSDKVVMYDDFRTEFIRTDYR